MLPCRNMPKRSVNSKINYRLSATKDFKTIKTATTKELLKNNIKKMRVLRISQL